MVVGRFLGVVFGLMFGGPLGAILGFLLGYQFDRSFYGATQRRTFSPTPEQQRQFLIATFGVMGHLAKASGYVSKEEIQIASHYMDRMGLQDALRTQAQDAFRDGKADDFPIDAVLEQVYETFSSQRDVLRFFLEMQLQAAFADGALDDKENEILSRVAQQLHISSAEFNLLLQMVKGGWQAFNGGGSQQGYQHSRRYGQQQSHEQRLQGAYRVLGAQPSMSDQEVKKAYRKEMSTHHPDKLAAKGLPPEMMELAKQKAQDIQQAWEIISQHRGLR